MRTILLIMALTLMPVTAAAIDTPDGAGRSPLLQAVEAGDAAEALRLIEAGSDLNVQAANQDTPWLQAGALGRTDILAAMLDKGGIDYKVRNRYGGNALIPACERGHVETVRLLLERSEIDVNHVNNLGWTCLLEAVILGDGGQRHQQIVQLLLGHGADVNLADRNGETPLAHARQRGQSAVVAMLVGAGAR